MYHPDSLWAQPVSHRARCSRGGLEPFSGVHVASHAVPS